MHFFMTVFPGLADWDFSGYSYAETSAPIWTDLEWRSASIIIGDLKKYCSLFILVCIDSYLF